MIDLISYPVSYLVLGALAIFLRPNFANTIGMLSIISSMLCLLVVSDSQILKYKIINLARCLRGRPRRHGYAEDRQKSSGFRERTRCYIALGEPLDSASRHSGFSRRCGCEG